MDYTYEPAEGGKLRFTNPASLKVYLAKESERATELLNLFNRQRNNPGPTIRDEHKNRVGQVATSVRNRAENISDEEPGPELLATVTASLDDLYKVIPPKGTRDYQLIEYAREFGVPFHTGVAAAVISERIKPRSASATEPNGFAFGQLMCLESPTSPFALAMNETSRRYEEELRALLGRRDEAKEGLEKIAEAFKEELKQHSAEFAEILKVKEPANYWVAKRHWHLGVGIGFGLLTLASGFFGGWYVIWRSHEVTKAIDGLQEHSFATHWPRLLPLLVSFVLVFWLLRILVRMFLSQMHQLAEASKRAVLIRTWLAMHVGEHKPTEADRAIMLTSIFHHGSDGLVPDDGAPQLTITKLTDVKAPGLTG